MPIVDDDPAKELAEAAVALARAMEEEASVVRAFVGDDVMDRFEKAVEAYEKAR